jgi:hypothetical protein
MRLKDGFTTWVDLRRWHGQVGSTPATDLKVSNGNEGIADDEGFSFL